jgi:hypothetical protein
LEKFRADNEKIAKDIPVLKEVIEGTWRKEPELAALKAELTELDRKIQLSLNRQQAESIDELAQSMPRRDGGKDRDSGIKPIEDNEGESINEPETGNVQAPPQDILQPSQNSDNSHQLHIPSRLREITDASDGRIVVAGVGSPSRKSENPPNKGFKI